MNLFFVLFLGFILGIKHAFEADHVVAVSAIIVKQKNVLKSALIGLFWGIGHTVTLLIVSLFVIFLKVSLPDKLILLFEFLVGLMLIALGIRVLIKFKAVHVHEHKHDSLKHKHSHYHKKNETAHSHHSSFFIGLIHGLAGSGVLTLLVLSTIGSEILGVVFVLLFGLGSILGMMLMSLVIGYPFLYIKKIPKIEKYIRLLAGTISVVLGLVIVYEIWGKIF